MQRSIHRNSAKEAMANVGRIVRSFDQRTAREALDDAAVRLRGRAPSPKEVGLVLRSVIQSAPSLHIISVKQLTRALLSAPYLSKRWPGDPDKLSARLENTLECKNNPPRDDWDGLHEAMAPLAAQALGLEPTDAKNLLEVIKRPQRRLEHCVDAVFEYVEGYEAPLQPSIDSVLGEAPFWSSYPPTRADPHAKVLAHNALELLRDGEKKLIYVFGRPFSAKREILKGVVAKLEHGFLLNNLNRRLPTLAIAAAGMGAKEFVDRVFEFYSGYGAVSEALQKSLDVASKISFIRSAAATHPALCVFADIDLFDTDPMIRHLRGDSIGDVLEAILDGHGENRLLIGVSSMSSDLPWRDDACEPIEAPPSDDEFSDAIEALAPSARQRYAKYSALAHDEAARKPLSALTMQLARPVFEQSRGQPTLAIPDPPFELALDADNPHAVFSCVWQLLYPLETQILLGLIAGSHDGLTEATLVGVLMALKHLAWPDEMKDALQATPVTPEALSDWGAANGSVVRMRVSNDSKAERTYYLREPIRQLVLEAWLRERPNEARDGLWCMAREAAHQAREQYLSDRADAHDLALARNLQVLHMLLASIDLDGVEVKPMSIALAANIESLVLPPLDARITSRPNDILAFRYCWNQLYSFDIEGGQKLPAGDVVNDPATRLAALLRFFSPHTPWVPTDEIRLTSEAARSVGWRFVQKALTHAEQIQLLTVTATAALRAKRFDLVLACVALGEALEPHANDVPLVDFVRLYRTRLSLGMLHAGNPASKNPSINPVAKPPPAEPYNFALDWVFLEGAALLARLTGDDEATTVARGKLHLRLAEAHVLAANPTSAARELRQAARAENKLVRGKPLGASYLPISSGRGIRSVVRHALAPAPDADFVWLQFSDGLHWPSEPVLPEGRLSKRVSALLAANKHRARRGKIADRLGARVDAAHCALRCGKFEVASLSAGEALKMAHRRGVAFETLYELTTLRAMVAMELAMRVPRLSRNDAAHLELQAAFEVLNKLATLSSLDPIVATRYLVEGQLHIARSRIHPSGSPEAGSHLEQARLSLVQAAARMEQCGCRQHLKRTQATLAALDSMLKRPSSPVSHPD